MPRVFLACDLERIQLSNLRQYGELVYLYERTAKPNMWRPDIAQEFLGKFEEKSFDPDLDFYAASGIMPLSHIVLGTLIEEYGEIKTLLFDRSLNKYRIKIIGGESAYVRTNKNCGNLERI